MSVDQSKQVLERFNHALAMSGLTQAELASRSGVARTNINKFANRGSRPRDRLIQKKIARTLNVTPEWLWFGKDANKPVEDFQPSSPPAAPLEEAFALSKPWYLGYRFDPKGYLMEIDHDDFAPLAVPGDMLYVTPSYRPKPGDLTIIKSGSVSGVYRVRDIKDGVIEIRLGAGSVTLDMSEDCTAHPVSGVVIQ